MKATSRGRDFQHSNGPDESSISAPAQHTAQTEHVADRFCYWNLLFCNHASLVQSHCIASDHWLLSLSKHHTALRSLTIPRPIRDNLPLFRWNVVLSENFIWPSIVALYTLLWHLFLLWIDWADSAGYIGFAFLHFGIIWNHLDDQSKLASFTHILWLDITNKKKHASSLHLSYLTSDLTAWNSILLAFCHTWILTWHAWSYKTSVAHWAIS